MTPHLFAERGAGEVAALPEVHRFAQARGEGLGFGSLVGVADQFGARIGSVLDAIKPRR